MRMETIYTIPSPNCDRILNVMSTNVAKSLKDLGVEKERNSEYPYATFHTLGF